MGPVKVPVRQGQIERGVCSVLYSETMKKFLSDVAQSFGVGVCNISLFFWCFFFFKKSIIDCHDSMKCVFTVASFCCRKQRWLSLFPFRKNEDLASFFEMMSVFWHFKFFRLRFLSFLIFFSSQQTAANPQINTVKWLLSKSKLRFFFSFCTFLGEKKVTKRPPFLS